MSNLIFPGWQDWVPGVNRLDLPGAQPPAIPPELVGLGLAGIAAATIGGVAYMATHKEKKVILERWDNQEAPKRELPQVGKAVKNLAPALILGALFGASFLATQPKPTTEPAKTIWTTSPAQAQQTAIAQSGATGTYADTGLPLTGGLWKPI